MAKAGYVDGFVFSVPKKNKKDYLKMAELGRKTWMKHGALAYFECVGDDLKVQDMGGMKTRSFKEAVVAGKHDEVWFSFIVFKNKKHRDVVNAKVMKDEDMLSMPIKKVPFDMNKMAYGGFSVLVGG